jgi:hypothetical protein
LRYGERQVPHGWASKSFCAAAILIAPKRRILVIDGYEQLAWWERMRIQMGCRRQDTGLLVTSHFSTGLPTLLHLAPDQRLVETLIHDLCSKVSTGITQANVAASWKRHGSNVRDIFFDLYDQHERCRHNARTRGFADA